MSNVNTVASATNLTFENTNLTAHIYDGEIHFRATELAKVLDYSNPYKAISDHVDKCDLTKREVTSKTGKSKSRRKQMVNFVNESGMYALVFGSTKPEAKRFKKWVTADVLPTIRKTGSYGAYQPTKEDIFSEAHTEVVNYLWSLYDEIKRLGGKVPVQPKFDSQAICNAYLKQEITFDRMMLSFDKQGEAQIKVIPKTHRFIPDGNFAKVIADPFGVDKKHLADIAQAVASRLGKLIN